MLLFYHMIEMSHNKVLSDKRLGLGSPEFWARSRIERHQLYDHLRATAPVSRQHSEAAAIDGGPGWYWAVTSYDLVQEVSASPDRFSNADGVRIFPMSKVFRERFANLIHLDAPEHTRLRKIVARLFTPPALKRLEQTMNSIAHDSIDDAVAKGRFDFVETVAAPLPLRVICHMMSIPESHYDEVRRHANAMLGADDPEMRYSSEQSMKESREQGAAMLCAILDMSIQNHSQNSARDNVFASLHAAHEEEGSLSRLELQKFFLSLVSAGTEAVRQGISHGILRLIEEPELIQKLRDDPNRLIPAFVEELLRYATPTICMRRTATVDTVLGDVQIEKGDSVVIYYQAANRDPKYFDEPHRFDINRAPNRHLAFGGKGPHYCLGAALARRELAAMFRAIVTRIPEIELAGEPRFLQSDFIDGIKYLPVRLAK